MKMGGKGYTRDFWILFVAGFLNAVNFSIIFPIAPLYAQSVGTPVEVIGVIISIATVVSLCAKLPYGYIADRKAKKRLLLFGSVIGVLSPLFYAMSSSPVHLALTRLFHGLATALGIASLALVKELAPETKSGEMLGVYEIASYSALVLGTALSGFLVDTLGFINTFYVGTTFSLMGLLTVLFVKEPETVRERSDTFLRGYRNAIRDGNVRLASFGIILLTITSGIIFAYLPIFCKDLGFATTNIGLFYTVWAFLSVIARPTMGKLSDWKGRSSVIIPTMGVATIGLFTMSTITSIAELYLTSILYGFGYASAFAVLTVMAVDTVAPQNRGSAFALFSSAYDIGIVAGSIGLGFVLRLTDFQGLFILTTFILLAGIVIFTIFSIDRRRKHVHDNSQPLSEVVSGNKSVA